MTRSGWSSAKRAATPPPIELPASAKVLRSDLVGEFADEFRHALPGCSRRLGTAPVRPCPGRSTAMTWNESESFFDHGSQVKSEEFEPCSSSEHRRVGGAAAAIMRARAVGQRHEFRGGVAYLASSVARGMSGVLANHNPPAMQCGDRPEDEIRNVRMMSLPAVRPALIHQRASIETGRAPQFDWARTRCGPRGTQAAASAAAVDSLMQTAITGRRSETARRSP